MIPLFKKEFKKKNTKIFHFPFHLFIVYSFVVFLAVLDMEHFIFVVVFNVVL